MIDRADRPGRSEAGPSPNRPRRRWNPGDLAPDDPDGPRNRRHEIDVEGPPNAHRRVIGIPFSTHHWPAE